MSLRVFSSGVLFMLAATLAPAQGPIHDRLTVTFSQPVVVGDKTLPPGEYTIRQLESANNPRLLEFSSENGMRVEATASAFATLDNLTSKETKVVLERRGGNQYVKQVWLRGKDYGYELVPGEVPAVTAQNQQMRMTATYQAPQPAPEPRQEIAQAPPPAPAPPPAREPEPAPAPAPEAAPAPEPAPAPAAPTPPMPDTAAGWPAMMIAGFMLTAAGTMVRRYSR
jgi:hypothetical protein